MKKRDLEKRLAELEWWFDSHGGSHDHSIDKYEQLLEAANPIHHPMLRVI